MRRGHRRGYFYQPAFAEEEYRDYDDRPQVVVIDSGGRGHPTRGGPKMSKSDFATYLRIKGALDKIEKAKKDGEKKPRIFNAVETLQLTIIASLISGVFWFTVIRSFM